MVVAHRSRERVTVSDELLGEARRRYPPGGSADGTPRFELFESGPLAGAVAYFERQYDNSPEAAAGVHFYTTVGTFFPAMAFYAARVGDHVEIISFTVDDDYWGLIEDDPE
ncbi:MAG TPA: hypothetical protein VNC61_14080 [Acidimicrobiales bacterium]|nr:hypothetical protein [Acidimicrobiales bacterium]